MNPQPFHVRVARDLGSTWADQSEVERGFSPIPEGKFPYEIEQEKRLSAADKHRVQSRHFRQKLARLKHSVKKL